MGMAMGMSTTHSYSAPGTYTVSAEVVNSVGDDTRDLPRDGP